MILLKPTLACNLNCPYCYQAKFRHRFTKYDVRKVIETAKELYKQKEDLIALHGGEPTTMPIEDIEQFLKFAYDMQGHSTINTNGVILNDDLIGIYKKYKTNVAVSIDGFPNLNPRGKKEITEKVMKNIEILVSEGIPVNLMIVLHRYNASDEYKLRKMLDFILYMHKLGVRNGKINYCHVEHNPELARKYELTPEELARAWLYIARLTIIHPELSYDPFTSFFDNLTGATTVETRNDCYFSMCDPFCTERAKVVLGDGSLVCCLGANNITHTFTRAEEPSYERYMVLQKIPVSKGGCKGCRYWSVCFGGCPSRQDWRMKDRFCRAYYTVYKEFEELLKSMGFKVEIPDYKVEDKPVHRIIPKRFNNGVKRISIVNGITVKEYPDRVEILYKNTDSLPALKSEVFSPQGA